MKKFLLAALVGGVGLAGLAGSAVSAAPAHPSDLTQTSSLVLAQYQRHDRNHWDHDRNHWDNGRNHHQQRYVPGRRYRSAPHGWHRYSRRPGDWRTRGCILAGPIWFCP